MKIVFFDFVIHFGGGPQLAADTARRLAREHEVYAFDAYGACKPYLERLREGGVNVEILSPEVKSVYIGYVNQKFTRLWRTICQVPAFMRLRSRLVKRVVELAPDVLWTNSKLGLAFLGTSLRLLRYPIVMEVVGCPDAGSIKGYGRFLMKHRLSMVMAISTETGQHLELAGIGKERIHVVYDTIDFEDTIRRSKQEPDKPLPGMERQLRIVVPANLIRAKGHYTAIKAVSRLKREGLEATLWIAGDVVGNDLSYQHYLEGLAKELGVSDNVYLLGWRTDVPAIISKSHVVVLPTHSEGFGHVILEGMLLKKPVITTPVGGVKDSIQDEHNGLLFPIDDDEALAKQLGRIYRDSELVERLIGNGYKTVTTRFTPENHTKRFTEGLLRAVKAN